MTEIVFTPLPLNDVQEGECSAGYIDTVDARESRPLPSSSRSGDPPRRGKAVQHRGRGDPKSPSFRGVRQHPVESPAEAQSSTLSFPFSNQPGDCVVAKSARLRFRLAAKATFAPLLLHLGLRAAAMRRLASKRACGRSFRPRSATLGSRPRRGRLILRPSASE